MGAADKSSLQEDRAPRYSLVQRILLLVLPRIIWLIFWLLGSTLRYEVIAEDSATPLDYGAEPGPDIFCFWHQCILLATIYFRHSHTVVLISQSFDGELVARVTKCFGYRTVRGSSAKGALRGLIGLKKHAIDCGRSAIFATDGPRGPAYQSKMGPIKLAQMTGARIRFFHLQPQSFWTLNSWDRCIIPKPFSRVVVSWARELHVPTDLAPEDFEIWRQQIDESIERARLRALHHLGIPSS